MGTYRAMTRPFDDTWISEGEYSSTSQKSPCRSTTMSSVSTPLGLKASWVSPSQVYGISSCPCWFDRPVTSLPDRPVIGIHFLISTPNCVDTLAIAGANSGIGKVRRFSPFTVGCPFGPRSVTTQNSPWRPAGKSPLPMPPSCTPRSSRIDDWSSLSGTGGMVTSLMTTGAGAGFAVAVPGMTSVAAARARPARAGRSIGSPFVVSQIASRPP